MEREPHPLTQTLFALDQSRHERQAKTNELDTAREGVSALITAAADALREAYRRSIQESPDSTMLLPNVPIPLDTEHRVLANVEFILRRIASGQRKTATKADFSPEILLTLASLSNWNQEVKTTEMILCGMLMEELQSGRVGVPPDELAAKAGITIGTMKNALLKLNHVLRHRSLAIRQVEGCYAFVALQE